MQRARRRAKRRAVALRRWAGRRGVSQRAVARRLGLPATTLSDWKRARDRKELESAPRGRRRPAVSRQTRAQIIEVLDATHGRIGVSALERRFAAVPRTRLRRLLEAYRRRHRWRPAQLTWTTPGAVWAADFTELLLPIDGRYGSVLSVRDLASGRQLLALPVEHATAAITVSALESLFASYGAPLVLKTDNGSHFTAGVVTTLLEQAQVSHLRSPPRTPRYNGSCEAGIGSLQTRLHHVASSHGRAAAPTCDDLEQARLEANAEARRCGPDGPSPDERWHERSLITPSQRAAFRAVVATATLTETRRLQQQRAEARRDGSHTALTTNELTTNDRATVARRAIRRALVESGLLIITGRTANSSADLTNALTEN